MRTATRDDIVGPQIADMNEVRVARKHTRLSQRAFAEVIGVSVETLRTWDSGRRPIPVSALAHLRLVVAEYTKVQLGDPGAESDDTTPRATSTAAEVDPVRAAAEARPMSLRGLALELGVSVYTLRAAARDGRLTVTYGTRVVFGRPVPVVTLRAGQEYRRRYYGRLSRWAPRPAAPNALPSIPVDYDARVLGLRRRLGYTQAQFAVQVGVASKAVIYQWESRKRRPSPVLWQRIDALERDFPTSLNRWRGSHHDKK